MKEEILWENDFMLMLKCTDEKEEFTWWELIIFGSGSLHLNQEQFKALQKAMGVMK